MTFSEHEFRGGRLLQGDVLNPSIIKRVRQLFDGEAVPLIIADPWYGEIVPEIGDTCEQVTGLKSGTKESETAFVDWMLNWTRAWSEILAEGGAMYVWGGVGKPGFRPWYGYMSRVERETDLTIAMPITWKKKRAYGVAYNYLFTREELVYLIKGDPKKPRRFHIPLTDKARGYKGYNKRYVAKSDMLRRTNVWEEDGSPNLVEGGIEEYRMADVWDETELLRGKRHVCQKVARVNEIPIQVHTEPEEGVVDLFSGSGSLAEAARRLGRACISVEKDPDTCAKIVEHLNS
jgi:DNA modification methylase